MTLKFIFRSYKTAALQVIFQQQRNAYSPVPNNMGGVLLKGGSDRYPKYQ